MASINTIANNGDLFASLTKEQIKEQYYELKGAIFDSLKNLNTATMWNAYNLNSELLNLYRKLYSTETDEVCLNNLRKFTYNLEEMNRLLEEIKVGVSKLNNY